MAFNTVQDWILLFLPLVICYAVSFKCKIGRDAGNNVKFRPPAAVFGIVWACLFICLGLSWVYSFTKQIGNRETTPYVIYSLIIFFLALWIILYGCAKKKKESIWVFIPLLMLCFMGLSIGTQLSRLLLSPLIGWLIFALVLATHDYQSS